MSERNLEWIVKKRGNEFSCGSRPAAKMGTAVCPLTSLLVSLQEERLTGTLEELFPDCVERMDLHSARGGL